MKRIFGMLLAVLAVGLFSCNNEKADVPELTEDLALKSAEIAVAEVNVEEVITEATYEVEFFANAEETLTKWWRIGKRLERSGKLRYKNQCPDIEISEADSTGYPKTITLNYGESTVLKNGKVLSGVVEIVISAPKKTKDYTKTVTYSDFGIDSVSVSGTSAVEVDRLDSLFREVTSDLTFTLADGTTISRSSTRTWQWLAGMDTEEDQTDDIIIIAGKAEANMDASVYKKEITTPLKRIGECKYIVEGVVVITLDGSTLCTMDYGDGTCDAIAIMTDADGEVTEIDLSERKAKKKQKKNQNGKNNG